MKKIFLTVLVFLLLLVSPAYAVKLVWNASASGNATGYQAYVADSESGPFTKLGDAVTGLEFPLDSYVSAWQGKTKFFYVKAFNEWGESPPSNIEQTLVAPPDAVIIKFQFSQNIIISQ